MVQYSNRPSRAPCLLPSGIPRVAILLNRVKSVIFVFVYLNVLECSYQMAY